MTVVIGISGPSCSGKSLLARRLVEILRDCTVLEQDWYFRSPAECPPDANFCDLQFLDVPAFTAAALDLAQGRAAVVPVMDFSNFEQLGSVEISAGAFLLIEGMTIFRVPEVRSLCDHRFYLAPRFELLATRKRLRDAVARAKPPSVIEDQLRWIRSEYNKDLSTIAAREILPIVSNDLAEVISAITRRLGGSAPSEPLPA